MKTNNQNVFKELENKLDRLEVESLKDYIEKQLKKLKKLQVKSINNMLICQSCISLYLYHFFLLHYLYVT